MAGYYTRASSMAARVPAPVRGHFARTVMRIDEANRARHYDANMTSTPPPHSSMSTPAAPGRLGLLTWLRDYFEAPPGSTPTEQHNFHYAFREAALIGVINAAMTFLPVFVARLGGSNIEVSLITTLPSLSGVLLAIPLGWFMQTRRNIIPWYAYGRIGGQAAFGAAALASFVMPAELVIPAILAIYGVAMVFSTATNVAFNVVMDATAGTRGRFELMSRRWSLMGFMTAVTLAVVGDVLNRLPFPLNYQLVFCAFSLTGLWAYQYGSRIRVPDHPPAARGSSGESMLTRTRALATRVRAERPFLAFEARRLVSAVSVTFTMPLVPLFYVRVLDASDRWIGFIGTTQSLMLLVGYAIWRQQSRTRGAKFVLAVAMFGYALYPAALATMHDVAIAAVLAGLGAVFSSGVNLAIFDRLMSTVPPGYGVTFNSIDTTVVYTAGVIAPIAAAALANRVGIEGALLAGAAVGLLAAALFALDRTPRAVPTAAPAGGEPAA